MNTTNAGWHVSQYRKTRLLYRDVQMSMSVGILLSKGHAGGGADLLGRAQGHHLTCQSPGDDLI